MKPGIVDTKTFTITSHYAHRQNALNAILTQTPQKEMFSPG
ncbi:hypothetical protein [Salmonella phage NBSal006]|uniref:Uncharacterized protein n=1 Tax=Salmonella phage NBSal006 TaxID=2749668 RepID=A0A7D7JZA7_9CAUD|nr:hypothetical protein QA045_gp48 [Salmonella phage NBSal006]QMP81848.1 hypothetical protein [Salmonella phage NBSal006]